MSDTLVHVVEIAGAVVAGAVVALRVIAPLTATKRDDDLLARLETVEAMLESLHLDSSDAVDPAPAAK